MINFFSPPVAMAGAMCLHRYEDLYQLPSQPQLQNSRYSINRVVRVVWNLATVRIFLWPHVTRVLGWSGWRRSMRHNPPHCLEPSSSSFSSSGRCLIISVAMTLITTWGDDVTGSPRKTPARVGGAAAVLHVDSPPPLSLHRLCE